MIQSYSCFTQIWLKPSFAYQENAQENSVNFGVPNKIITSLKVLDANFIVKFTVDDVTKSLDCIIGVEEGDILGPIFFTFFIAAVMIYWKASCNIPVCFILEWMQR